MRNKRFFSMILALLTVSSALNAETGVTQVYYPIQVYFSAPISFGSITPLSFGAFSHVNGSAGTLTLNTDNSRTNTANVDLVTSIPGVAGQIPVSGTAGQIIYFRPTAGFNVTLSNGSNTMNAALSWTATTPPPANPGTQANPLNCPTNGSGACTVYVGGVLTINATQATGAYTGTYTFNADYT